MRAGREELWTRRRAGTLGVLVRLSVLGALILSACGGSSEESASEPTLIATTTEQVTTTTVHPDDRAIDRGFVAMCNDGNYSDNLDFRATCSGGDGIDYWLSAFGRCADGSIVVMETRPSCGRDGFDRLMPRDFVPEQGPDDVAVCNDGNFSSNHNFAATCSGGDGVDYWLAPFGECSDGTAIKLSSTASCPRGTSFVGLLPADFVPPTTTTIADATPADIEVPDVIGLRLDNAITMLTDLGLDHVARDAIKSRSIFVRSNWVVVEQAPEPGATATANATIELGVARPKEAAAPTTTAVPATATPVTTAAPTTAAPTTAPATSDPVPSSPCPEPQERVGDLVCATSAFGPIWYDAPFSNDSDSVSVLAAEPFDGRVLQHGPVGVTALSHEVFENVGVTTWCFIVGIGNLSNSTIRYSYLEFSLLSPSGALNRPTIPLWRDQSAVLGSAQLSPGGGTQAGYVCFAPPPNRSGRFALVYEHFDLFTPGRALFYFDQ